MTPEKNAAQKAWDFLTAVVSLALWAAIPGYLIITLLLEIAQ